MEINQLPKKLLSLSIGTYLSFFVLALLLLWFFKPRIPQQALVFMTPAVERNEAFLHTELALENDFGPTEEIALKTFQEGVTQYRWFRLMKRESKADDEKRVYRVKLMEENFSPPQDSMPGFIYLRRRQNTSFVNYLFQ